MAKKQHFNLFLARLRTFLPRLAFHHIEAAPIKDTLLPWHKRLLKKLTLLQPKQGTASSLEENDND